MKDEAAHNDQDVARPTVRLEPCRYRWRDLDQHDAALLWTELIEWAQWLRRRYQLGSRVPACWYRHEPVVEELTALMAAHTAAYWCDPDTVDLPREDMTAWHTQWLWPTIERLTRISDFSGCRPHHCRYHAHPQPVHAGVQDYLDEQLASWPPRSAAPEPGR
ncbi:hypothetical protein HLB23_28935 [Nocardia uniformis]|uniref:Uncharacterized protein n=1 Tax=Nocardia uniformis TaxID=53432 RepID=A0A849C5C6_9NOCA|nr:hypothetical protein [Nocardia uniformis]NNH73832.1 hypothetical protein [Nocardia uniformis]